MRHSDAQNTTHTKDDDDYTLNDGESWDSYIRS